MQLDLSNNHFELFETDVVFDIDVNKLDTHYQQLQRVLHPDKFAQGSDAERRWSVQAASRVNDAYQTLKNPLKRASYILELQGLMLNEETDTQMDPMFLMEQMELREALDDAESASDPYAAIDKLIAQLGSQIDEHSMAYSNSAKTADWPEARKLVRQWQFLEKLKQEARQLEARLDDAEG
jgi:molecular chaperone HscB